MATTLIVVAHPEPTSFTASWAQASAAAVEADGGQVIWSDLYAMGFDPAERAEHFNSTGPFDPLKAQETASRSGLPIDVNAEVDKLRAADRIIVHFPVWWFAAPAILKGWCDRCLVHGALHSVDERFDSGLAKGKEVLFCISTGASAGESGPHGKEGDARLLLWPLAYTFKYCGYDILEPVLAHGVHGYHTGADKAALDARLSAVMADQTQVVKDWSSRSKWAFNPDSAFDGSGQLKAGQPAYWPFIKPQP